MTSIVVNRYARTYFVSVFKGVLRWQNRIWNVVRRYRAHCKEDAGMSDDVAWALDKPIFEIRNFVLKEVSSGKKIG